MFDKSSSFEEYIWTWYNCILKYLRVSFVESWIYVGLFELHCELDIIVIMLIFGYQVSKGYCSSEHRSVLQISFTTDSLQWERRIGRRMKGWKVKMSMDLYYILFLCGLLLQRVFPLSYGGLVSSMVYLVTSPTGVICSVWSCAYLWNVLLMLLESVWLWVEFGILLFTNYKLLMLLESEFGILPEHKLQLT